MGERVVPRGPRRDPDRQPGRFEAFLPTAQWEQVRDEFWARTGFPVDPDAAVEQLKARLSDASDRFLEGVADNRQVTFDDDGWRLKTDPAEPAQSDRLAELHRSLDARNRDGRCRRRQREAPDLWRAEGVGSESAASLAVRRSEYAEP